MSTMASMAQGLPYTGTIITPRVFGPIAFSISLGSMLKVWGSMSQITGISPHWITGHTVVDQESAGTITSSPGFNPSLVAGLASAATARRLADEPELFITPSVQPKVEQNTSSNFRTFGPMVT